MYQIFEEGIPVFESNKVFYYSNLDPRTEPTEKNFDLSTPRYKICKIIKSMKSPGSPCPLEQVSIICIKRCPYLSTYKLNMCRSLKNESNTAAWTRATTIQIYKKGDTNCPGNFRLITGKRFY